MVMRQRCYNLLLTPFKEWGLRAPRGCSAEVQELQSLSPVQEESAPVQGDDGQIGGEAPKGKVALWKVELLLQSGRKGFGQAEYTIRMALKRRSVFAMVVDAQGYVFVDLSWSAWYQDA